MKEKMIYFLSCFILLAGFTACSSDDKDPEELTKLGVSIKNGEIQDLILGNTLKLEAAVENGEGATYAWTLDETKLSEELNCEFKPEKVGTYSLKFTASTELDKATAEVTVNVSIAQKAVETIDDILFTAGEGDNESVLAVQWITGTEWDNPKQDDVHLLSWKYRWNEEDEATGQDMILAIAKADPRLVVFLGDGFTADSYTIRGFGYDANGDGQFSITNKETKKTYQLADFKDGVIKLEGSETGDDYESDDPADYWFGGWYKGYSSYYVGDASVSVPEKFGYSSTGVDGRKLSHQSWDAWSYSSINSGMVNTEIFGEWMVSASSN